MGAAPLVSWRLALFLTFLATLISSGVNYYYGKQAGIEQGLTEYHRMCYTGGPSFVIIDGAIVLCGPGGKLSEPEKKELDKGVKAWYHKYLKE